MTRRCTYPVAWRFLSERRVADRINRAKLQDQIALSEEIVTAMNSVQVGNQVDDEELEDELEQLQQEQLDEQMLKTGTVPVSDQIQRMPAVANGERKLMSLAGYESLTRRTALTIFFFI